MTNGERLVWAAAFVNVLSEFNEGFFSHALSMCSSERKRTQLLRAKTTEATEFADLAVNAMGCAKKELVKKKKKKTVEYERLIDMLEGKY